MVTKIKKIFLISLLLISNICIAEDKFWVGGSGNWSDDDNHWATSSGGLPGDGNIPTMIDDVYFDSNSHNDAYTLTIDGQADMKSMLWANPSSGTTTLAGSAAINIYGSLELPTDMDWQYAGTLTMGATTTGNTITTNGVILKSAKKIFNLSGVGGEWSLADNFTGINIGVDRGLDFRISAGTFNTNNHEIKVGTISSNADAIINWNLGSSKIYVYDGDVTTLSGVRVSTDPEKVTVDSGTSEFIFGTSTQHAGNRVQNFSGGVGIVWNKLKYVGDNTFSLGLNAASDAGINYIKHLQIGEPGVPIASFRFDQLARATSTIYKFDVYGSPTTISKLQSSGTSIVNIINPGVVWDMDYIQLGDIGNNKGGIVKLGGGRWFIGRHSIIDDANSSGYIADYYRRQLMRRR